MEDRIQKAVELFKSGYNCSQSVVAAFADMYGFTQEQALRMGASFGGGIGRMRETCGAACGMFLVAGLETGATEATDREGKAANYAVVQELAAEFKKIFAQTYLWILLLLLYSPIVIIVIYSFTEAKVLGNWTGFSTKLYSSLFTTGAHHSLMNALINTITIALLAATASTLLGSIAAIGIFNLKARSRKAIGFVNSIPILNGDIITGISLFLLFNSIFFIISLLT